ncbi:hypothetical protein ABID25_005846 [Mesorhizobium abyssinicae]
MPLSSLRRWMTLQVIPVKRQSFESVSLLEKWASITSVTVVNTFQPPGQVGDPRHILIFRIAKDGIIDILGFIHDNMLLKRALRRLLNADRENE